MANVTIRELRNQGGEVVDRVQRGERLVVTRAGQPVAELVPVPRPAVSSTVLLERWRQLPSVDQDALRADLDAILDAGL